MSKETPVHTRRVCIEPDSFNFLSCLRVRCAVMWDWTPCSKLIFIWALLFNVCVCTWALQSFRFLVVVSRPFPLFALQTGSTRGLLSRTLWLLHTTWSFNVNKCWDSKVLVYYVNCVCTVSMLHTLNDSQHTKLAVTYTICHTSFISHSHIHKLSCSLKHL